MKLSGKRALVTGGGSGIGFAVAESFAREGATVAITGRNLERLEAARARAGELAPRIHPRRVDVSVRDEVRQMVDWAEETLGGIDILVNNAGVNVPERALAKLRPEEWRLMVEVNLNGAFYCTRDVLPQMRERRDGIIINISSVAGVRISEIAGVGYSASKFGMSTLSYFTGIEERQYGIRCSLICPGEVNTPILAQRPKPVSEEHLAQILQPEDVAAAVLFVATLPPRANVPELVITPTSARFG